MGTVLWVCLTCLMVASKSFVSTAPSGGSINTNENQRKPPETVDEAVRELENLKPGAGRELAVMKTQSMMFSNVNGKEEHHLNKDQLYEKDGKLIARISEKVDKEGSNAPRVKTELDIPSKNIHKVLEKEIPSSRMQQKSQDQPTIFDDLMDWKNLGFLPEMASRKIQTNIQEMVKSPPSPQSQFLNQKDIFAKDPSRTTDQQGQMGSQPSRISMMYSPQELAEYVFWTRDEKGATSAIEDFIQDGTLSREDAIAYLEEIKRDLDAMKRQYPTREEEHAYNMIKSIRN